MLARQEAPRRWKPPSPAAQPVVSLQVPLWELDKDSKRGVFNFRPHRDNYLLPVRIAVPVGKLGLVPSGDVYQGQFFVYFVVLDALGRPEARFVREIAMPGKSQHGTAFNVAFAPRGDTLVVTEKATNKIDTFVIRTVVVPAFAALVGPRLFAQLDRSKATAARVQIRALEAALAADRKLMDDVVDDLDDAAQKIVAAVG